jgi:hypothetical protein
VWEWETRYKLRILLQFPHFWPILKLAWLVLRIFTRWLLKGVSNLFKWTKWRWIKRWGKKCKVKTRIFTSERRFEFIGNA